MNPGISRLVVWLNLLGFETTDSGDGATHDFPCDRPNAYVSVLVAPERLASEAVRMEAALDSIGVVLSAPNDEGRPYLQGTFCPTDGLAILDLANVDDSCLLVGSL